MFNHLFLNVNAQRVMSFLLFFFSAKKLRSARSIFIAIDSLLVRTRRQAFNLCLGAV